MPMKKTSEIIWQDTQHQLLFELIDQLKENQIDPGIFAKLNSYAENHFSLEEEYMRVLNYPDAEEHIEAHNKFRTELEIMVAEQHTYDENLRRSLSLFLTEWLTRHVLGIDKDFERFVMESEYK